MNDRSKSERFYDAFREIIALVHSSTDLNEVLEIVVWKVTQVLDAKGAILRILDLENGHLELGAAYGLSDKYLRKGPVRNLRVIEELHRQDRPVIFDDVLNDPRIQYPKEAWEEGIRTMLNLPITMRKNLIGIIRILFSGPQTFGKDDLDFLTSVARQCACAIERARLFQDQEIRYTELAIQTEKLSALGRMSAGIAHEINNPLAGILLYSSNMRKKVPNESQLAEGLDVIIQETIRCRGIIQHLLEFSRTKEPKKAETDLNSIIEKASGLLESVFHLNRITLEKQLSLELPKCFVDPNQIEQVFLNLFLNAAEAVQENGRVAVRSYFDAEQACVCCEIEDTGGGIPEENLSKIYEPFYSTKHRGTGLGLSVTYGIIQNHRGNLKVFSKVGEGTRFVVEIPVC
jgi:two-component system, NtrC family, sensor kinase